MEVFAKNLSLYRLKHHETQKDLAKFLGCSSQTILHWENGFNNPTLEYCVKIADHYHITLDELIGRDIKLIKKERIDNIVIEAKKTKEKYQELMNEFIKELENIPNEF